MVQKLILHLQNIWPDVDTWWKSNKVQNVIKKIITQFSDNPKTNFLRDMKYKINEKEFGVVFSKIFLY